MDTQRLTYICETIRLLNKYTFLQIYLLDQYFKNSLSITKYINNYGFLTILILFYFYSKDAMVEEFEFI